MLCVPRKRALSWMVSEKVDELQATIATGGPPGSDPEGLLGTLFAQKFQIIELLGEGGMSVVYRARHLAMDKEVAIKVLNNHRSSDETTVRRFKQEAHAASALSHPSIVAIHDCGIDDKGTPYLVMDYVAGKSLSKMIKEGGPLPLDRFLEIMQQVSSALTHAHSRGVVHRDLKPSNIMISENNDRLHAHLVDFGIAKVLTPGGEGIQQLTQTGEVFGSPLYMSPEQCSGAQVDQRTDIYSFGCVMYEALSGAVPHSGESVFETINKHVNDLPAPLSAPQISEEARKQLEVLLFRSLAKAPEDRPQRMDDVEMQLRVLQLGDKSGIFGKLGSAWQLAAVKRRAAKKNKLPLMVVTLTTVSCLSLASVLWLMGVLNSADAEIGRLEHSRKIVSQISLAQTEYIRFGDYARQYLMAVFMNKFAVPRAKALYERSKVSALKRLDILEEALQDDPRLLRSFKRRWRPKLEEIPKVVSAKIDPMVNNTERAMNFFDVADNIQLAKIASDGVNVLSQMAVETKKVEAEQIGNFRKTGGWIRFLSITCAALNGAVVIALLVYFVRGTPQRLKQVAENAAELSRRRGLGMPVSKSSDAVADLDGVLNELANALSEAEKREEILLKKLHQKIEETETKQV